MKFLSPEVALCLYKSTIRPCMECCCHVWACASSCYLELLDKLQKQIYRTVCPSLVTSLEPLAHRRMVASLSILYRYYFGRCYSELSQLILQSLMFSGILGPQGFLVLQGPGSFFSGMPSLLLLMEDSGFWSNCSFEYAGVKCLRSEKFSIGARQKCFYQLIAIYGVIRDLLGESLLACLINYFDFVTKIY